MTTPTALTTFLDDLERLPSERLYGRVASVLGMLVEVTGLEGVLSVGGRCDVLARGGRRVPCEVVGFREKRALLLPFGSVEGIALGCKAELAVAQPRVRPEPAWLGRVVNALGQPIDGKGPLPQGREAYPLRAAPPPAHGRKRVGNKIDLGVRALNTFQTCCRGQRMGIFAGSGVGKSVLLSMLARYTASDVNVIGLIGERGREVQEWLEDELGPEGLARSIVVVATSDEPPPMRRQAVYLTMALAEYFRDRGQDVLCLIDSITRFAMALREIGLAAGEPPAAKGYTPSVFGELPQVLERAGPGVDTGSITGLFTVLVEGDDHNEPIADAVRGILDGHIVLDRQIAERGRYPAINTLRSISRTMPACNTQAETDLVTRARRLLSTYEDMGELIRIGAYKHGSDPKVDEAIKYVPAIEAFLSQDKHDRADLDGGYAELARILGVEWAPTGQGAAVGAQETPDGAQQPGNAADGQPTNAKGKPIPPKNDLRRARRQQKKPAGAAAGSDGA